ncbi:MAG: hypothetical protein E1N59_1122 [Puniceicoccaceae bacterium 5H]|nr:MAG: hypothetical protein E1N59_1122 [Puniceicoccaceae bacterium 5H]
MPVGRCVLSDQTVYSEECETTVASPMPVGRCVLSDRKHEQGICSFRGYVSNACRQMCPFGPKRKVSGFSGFVPKSPMPVGRCVLSDQISQMKIKNLTPHVSNACRQMCPFGRTLGALRHLCIVAIVSNACRQMCPFGHAGRASVIEQLTASPMPVGRCVLSDRGDGRSCTSVAQSQGASAGTKYTMVRPLSRCDLAHKKTTIHSYAKTYKLRRQPLVLGGFWQPTHLPG